MFHNGALHRGSVIKRLIDARFCSMHKRGMICAFEFRAGNGNAGVLTEESLLVLLAPISFFKTYVT